MDAMERQNAIDEAFENGQYAAGAVLVQGTRKLSILDELLTVRHNETARLQKIVDAAMPAQTEECKIILSTPSSPRDHVADDLRTAAKHARINGGQLAAEAAERMATLIERHRLDPQIASILDLRNRISIAGTKQTNAEIRRCFSMAMTPADTIISNTGDRIA